METSTMDGGTTVNVVAWALTSLQMVLNTKGPGIMANTNLGVN